LISERSIVSAQIYTTHVQAVDDSVNVGAFGIFCIETEITKRGGKVEPTIEQLIEIRDKRTRNKNPSKQWAEPPNTSNCLVTNGKKF
jgi:hypothetical protein